MNKRGRSPWRVIALFLLAASLFGFVCPTVSGEGELAEYDASKYDFSHKSTESVILDSVDIAKQYLESFGESLSEAEIAFLEKYDLIRIKYSDKISTEYAKLSYDEASKTLRVIASEYSYSSGEKTFKWLPVSAEVGGEVRDLIGGECEFSGVEWGYEVRIGYEAQIPLSRGDIGALINLYHDTAEYVAEFDGYDEHMAAYEEYLIALRIYNEAKAKYEKYLSEYENYLGEYDIYLEYEAALREYWKEYENYESYLALLDKYDSDMKKYEEYLKALEVIRHRLAAFELVKVRMTKDRCIHSAVMGDLVDKVLENETALVEACGVDDPKIIWQAGDATERLRTLMTEYYEQPDERQKYNYYLYNYNNIRESVHELLNALNKLYSYRKVRAMLIADEKDEKYIILVAQLALVANALTDAPLTDYDGKAAYGATWKIEGKTISAILENKTYYEDKNDAAPNDGGYPAEIALPTLPDYTVEEPTMPEQKQKPIPPDAVEDPGDAPSEVREPTLPVAKNHLAKEVLATLSGGERAELRLAFESGSITERGRPESDHIFKASTSISRTVGKGDVEITFISDTGEVIESHTVEKDGMVIFEADEPYRDEDEYNSYRFAGWQNADGDMISLDSVSQSCEVYPYFEKAPKYYDITWIVDGKSATERVISDVIPECPISTDKAGDLQYYYVFDGWDKPLEPVGRDITYTAVYKRCYVVSYQGGGATVTDDGDTVVCDARSCITVDDEPINIGALLEKIAGKRALTLRTVRADLSFGFAQTLSLYRLGVDSVYVDVLQSGSVSNTFSFELLSGGSPISESILCDAGFHHNVEVVESLRLLKNSDVASSVKFSLDGAKISFGAQSGTQYKLRPVYNISVISDTGVNVTLSKLFAEPGETVKVKTQYVYGYEAKALEVIELASGENILMPDGSFRMPKGDVAVRGTSKLKTYTVTFSSEGKIVSSEIYTHGTPVIPPDAPAKAADGKFIYTFVGWSPDITSYISADASYEAIWHTEIIPEKVDDGSIKLSDSVRSLLAMAFSAAVIFVVGVIPCIVLSIVLRTKYKKRKFGQN